jgi:hypothetical protein
MSARELTASLEDKFGFAVTQGKKHEKYRLSLGGVYVAHTTVSHGWDDITDTLLSMIARQLGVTAQQLRLMVGCTISRSAYVELVTETPSSS